MALGGILHGDDRAGGGHQRVAAVDHRGGTGVIALAGHGEAPAAVGEDRRRHRHGPAQVDQAAALLHVQFDEEADPGEGLPVRAEVCGVKPGAAGGFRQGDPIGVDERAGPVGVDAAGQQPGAQAGDPEPGPLLLGEDEHGQRA